MGGSQQRATQPEIDAAFGAVAKAAAIVRRHVTDGFEVRTKPDGSPVTAADTQAEAAMREHLTRAMPGCGFIGEEFGSDLGNGDRWIIDPIDGTKNFVAGIPYYATLLALERSGELVLGIVHAPALDTTWWAAPDCGAWRGAGLDREQGDWHKLQVSGAERLESSFICHGGLRYFQSEGLWEPFSTLVGRVARTRGFGDWWGHMLAAEGKCDAMIDPRVSLHDVAAVRVIVEAAGGAVNKRGGRWFVPGEQTGIVTGSPKVVTALKEHLGF